MASSPGAYNPSMATRLDSLERQLEGLVERALPRLLGGSFSVTLIAAQLARAVDDGLHSEGAGQGGARDHYALTLHPEDLEALLDQAPDLRIQLSKGLAEAARVHGYRMPSEPEVTLLADPTQPRWEVRVQAWHVSQPLEFTRGMPAGDQAEPIPMPPGAFFIIDGERHFPLDRPVVNLGRRLENQIVLDDPHVSRMHAQLRVREGRFVLFDLGSTAGTRVNGRPIRQHVLRAGDVIRIGGCSLVYGEDPGGAADSTPICSPAPSNEPAPSGGHPPGDEVK